jgi:hypothetical protein
MSASPERQRPPTQANSARASPPATAEAPVGFKLRQEHAHRAVRDAVGSRRQLRRAVTIACDPRMLGAHDALDEEARSYGSVVDRVNVKHLGVGARP